MDKYNTGRSTRWEKQNIPSVFTNAVMPEANGILIIDIWEWRERKEFQTR